MPWVVKSRTDMANYVTFGYAAKYGGIWEAGSVAAAQPRRRDGSIPLVAWTFSPGTALAFKTKAGADRLAAFLGGTWAVADLAEELLTNRDGDHGNVENVVEINGIRPDPTDPRWRT